MIEKLVADSIRLPNGTYLYPHRLKSIDAYRKGRPPNVTVELVCVTAEGDRQVERILCDTWQQSDAVGNVIKEAMEDWFPNVSLSFLQET